MMSRAIRILAFGGLLAAVSEVNVLGFSEGQTQVGQPLTPAPQATATPPAMAKPAADSADMTTATYGDWLLRCQRTTGQPATQTCEVVQSLVLQGQTAPLAQLAFGRPGSKEPIHFTAVVPVNVAFPSTVQITLDEKDAKPVNVAFTRCLPTGCFASVALTDDALARWRAHDQAGRLVFKNGSGQETAVPMSFRGLSRALDALAKETAGR
jgi:invasion protein IalB